MNSTNLRLNYVQEEQRKTEDELKQTKSNLKLINEEKHILDCHLASAQTALMLQEQTLDGVNQQKILIQDKLNSTNRSLKDADIKNNQLQKNLEKQEIEVNELKETKKLLTMRLDEIERKMKNSEIDRKATEDELEETKLTIDDRNITIQALEEQLSILRIKYDESEERTDHLYLIINKLENSSISIKQEHQQKVESLQDICTNQNTNMNRLQEKLIQMERVLAEKEQENRMINERLLSIRQTLNEATQQNEKLVEKIQRLQFAASQAELRNVEVNEKLRKTENSQAIEQELSLKLDRVKSEKEDLVEELSLLKRNLSSLETGKVEFEKTRIAIEKAILKVEKEKMDREEQLSTTTAQLRLLEQETRYLQEENDELRVLLTQLKTNQHQKDIQFLNSINRQLNIKRQQEVDLENEKLKSSIILQTEVKDQHNWKRLNDFDSEVELQNII